MKYLLEDVWRVLTNRLLIMFCILLLSFYLLAARLFELQIVKGEEYQQGLNSSSFKPSTIPAVRGAIYDRYGRPLAVNTPVFTVKIDPSIKSDNTTETMYNLLLLLEANGEKIIPLDTFPISKDEPYTFLFSGSKTRESNWKRDMTVDQDASAAEAFDYLREKFEIPKDMPNDEARSLLALRSSVYMERYNFNTISVAQNVKSETIAAIEEQYEKYRSVYVDVEYFREYPQGIYMSHILGYIRGISVDELELYKDYEYKPTDVVGKDGIEKAFELQLRGQDGERIVEIQTIGRRTTSSVISEPVAGDKVFLTIDAELQKSSYEILKDMLSQILINKISGTFAKQAPLTVREVLGSMLLSNAVSIKKIITAEEDTAMYNARQYILEKSPDNLLVTEGEIQAAKEILADGVKKGTFSTANMFLILLEQGIITGDEAYSETIKKANNNQLRQMLIDKIRSEEITPQMVNQEPSSGSVVVVDVNTGDVLAAAVYPSYDNNEFVNYFNNEYYNQLQNDPTTPLNNRAFSEPRAPGSTFKILTAITGLMTGAITPKTLIYDEYTFTKAGTPFAKCSGYHGYTGLAGAIEASCNYYFYETAYIMGNAKDGNPMESIHALNEYMRAFGLDSPTGVEIYELNKNISGSQTVISSPEYMQYLFNARYGPDAKANWLDGDTIRTAIGQSYNNYTPATMAKYFATLATKGIRYQLHLLDKIESSLGELRHQFEPVVENVVEIDGKYWDVIYEGMLGVTQGQKGTARGAFDGFEMNVAGKTGTAQQEENRNEHTQFGCFAPYEDPQIAVFAVIPYGYNQTTSAPAAQIAREVIEKYFALNAEPETYSYNDLAK